jgi:hypothetical protein
VSSNSREVTFIIKTEEGKYEENGRNGNKHRFESSKMGLGIYNSIFSDLGYL